MAEVLKEAVPRLTRAALLFNPDSTAFYRDFLRELEGRGASSGLYAAPVRTLGEIEPAIADIAPGTGRRSRHPAEPLHRLEPQARRRARAEAQGALDLGLPGLRRGGRADVVRT
jgi:putative ABC transport system substrate-binding protein